MNDPKVDTQTLEAIKWDMAIAHKENPLQPALRPAVAERPTEPRPLKGRTLHLPLPRMLRRQAE